jgi:hypothetical protein
MERDVPYARSGMGTADFSRSTWRTLCLDNRNYLMFMVPYILVIYVQLKVQLDVIFMYSLFFSFS